MANGTEKKKAPFKRKYMNYLIEIATNDFSTAEAAVKGGADRLELCSALSEGGLTPSFGFIRRSRERFSLPIFPIIRPRGGDFLYSEEEYAIMVQDALFCREVGCEGVVFGFLNGDGSIDKKRTAALVEKVYPLEVTFHRAFDRCTDPFAALEDLIDCGCQRILTSGQQVDVLQATGLLRQLIEAADDRIIILPGSGVRPHNVAKLRDETGATEFHASLRSRIKSGMEFRHPNFEKEREEYELPFIDAEDVRQMRLALQS